MEIPLNRFGQLENLLVLTVSNCTSCAVILSVRLEGAQRVVLVELPEASCNPRSHQTGIVGKHKNCGVQFPSEFA